MAVAHTRHVRIRPAESDDITLPKDVADVLGPDAELEVAAGQVTIRRRGGLSRTELSAIAKPTRTAEQLLGHTPRRLTEAERAALNNFLAE